VSYSQHLRTTEFHQITDITSFYLHQFRYQNWVMFSSYQNPMKWVHHFQSQLIHHLIFSSQNSSKIIPFHWFTFNLQLTMEMILCKSKNTNRNHSRQVKAEFAIYHLQIRHSIQWAAMNLNYSMQSLLFD